MPLPSSSLLPQKYWYEGQLMAQYLIKPMRHARRHTPVDSVLHTASPIGLAIPVLAWGFHRFIVFPGIVLSEPECRDWHLKHSG